MATKAELQTQIAQLEAMMAMGQTLGQMSQELNAACNVDDLLQILTRPAREAGALSTSLMYIDLNETGEPEWIETVATWQQENAPPPPVGARFYLPEFPFSRLWMASPDKPLLIADIATDERMDENTSKLMAQIGIRAFAIIPLTQVGRWVGIITFNWAEPHQFNEQEAAICEALTGLVSPIVESRRLLNRAQETVKELNQLTTTMNVTSDFVGLIDLQGQLFYINPAGLDMVGRTGEDPALLALPDFHTPEMLKEIREKHIPIVMEKGTHYWEGELQHVDGSIIPVSQVATLIRNEAGEPEALGAIIRDITEQKQAEARIEAQVEERTKEVAIFRALAENSLDAIFIIDLESRFTYANRAAHELFGYDYERQEMIGQLGADYWPEEDLPILTETVLPQAMAGGWSGELRQKRKDGVIFYVRTAIFPLRDTEGQITGLAAVVRDITKRKQAGQALRTSEERLQAILDNASAVIYLKDGQGKYILINRQYEELFHISREEIVGKTDYDLFPKEMAEAFRENDQEVLESKTLLELEELVPQDDGLHTYISTKFPLLDPNGVSYAVCGISTDITERKQMEESLRESETRYKLALASTNDGFWDWNMATGKVFFSDRYYTMLGYEPADFPPSFEAWEKLVHPDDAADANQDIEKHLKGETETYQTEFRAQTKDGRWVWLLSRGGIVERADDGAPIRIMGTHTDITAQKEAETERERLQQEIIEAQKQAIQELSTPVIPIMERIIVMPLVGSIDSMRARDITRSLLAGIRENRAKVVILDITGVSVVDSGVANHLNKTIQAARLKGARTIITGISDAVAETIVDLGIDWSGITTLSDLQTGLIAALSSMGLKLNQ